MLGVLETVGGRMGRAGRVKNQITRINTDTIIPDRNSDTERESRLLVMSNNDGGKGVVYAYEAYEAK